MSFRVVILLPLLQAACAIENSISSPNSKEARIRSELQTLHHQTADLRTLTEKLEAEIDNIRRNPSQDSEIDLQKLQKKVEEIRQKEEALQRNFRAWKQNLRPQNN